MKTILHEPTETKKTKGKLRPRGSNQGGVRQYNERVILQVLRTRGALPGAEIARLTGLTSQTASVITKRLTEEGLILRGTPVRGKVGQPSVPLSLNPEGAYSIGVNVGRRRLEVLLVDFEGKTKVRHTTEYAFPTPENVLSEIESLVTRLLEQLDEVERERLQGVGLAAPLTIGGWQQLLGFPQEVSDAWGRTDLRGEVEKRIGLPVMQIKDTAAACIAELVEGQGRSIKSFLYLFVDTFIGGGLVIDSHLRAGVHGNAGAVGSLSLGLSNPETQGTPEQLLNVASLISLEHRYRLLNLKPDAVVDGRAMQQPWWPVTQDWLKEAANAIALSVHSAACLLELDGCIVDGAFSRELLQALVGQIQIAIKGYNWQGVSCPELISGIIGSDARAIGGALLPLYENFAPDRDLFLKID